MNIYAKHGDKVIYLDENGHDYEREDARELFRKGSTLTIERVDVGGWTSRVYFIEVPDKGFNTVMFDDIKEV